MRKQSIRSSDKNTNVKVVNLHGIRKYNIPYVYIWVIYYAWVIAFSTWWTASPLTENVFGTDIRALMHAVNLLSSAGFIFIIRKEWYVIMARVGAIFIILSMLLYLTVPNTFIQFASVMIVSISLGCVNTSILMPFVFALNNTEKMYAVVGSNVLINIISFFQEANRGNNLRSNQDLIFSFVIMLIALGAILFFKRSSIEENEKKMSNIPIVNNRIYSILVINCLFAILCKGAGKGILNITVNHSELPLLYWHYCGGFIGCFIFIMLYFVSAKAIIWLGNLAFGCMAIGLLANAFVSQNPHLAILFSLLLGMGNTIGMIIMYYVLGVIGKKYNSMRYIRMSILFIGICGGVSGVIIGRTIHAANSSEVSILVSMLSATILIFLLILSPAFVHKNYFDDWIKDSTHIDVDNEELTEFRKYNLSNREIEVCKLLLKGFTLRQISGTLYLSYSTVNTYCTSLYRKLGISSRTELMVMFKEYT